jgi:hypothetical protein
LPPEKFGLEKIMHRIKTVRSQTGAFVCPDRNVALHKSNFTLYGKHVKVFLVQRNISVIETTKDPVWGNGAKVVADKKLWTNK